MYNLINQYASTIVRETPLGYVQDYEWLLDNIGPALSQEYKREFRKFWAMNSARLNHKFYERYFALLSAPTTQAFTLNQIVDILYDESMRGDGSHSVQFSFVTKLLHMQNPHVPIYDSQVAAFYFFRPPPADANLLWGQPNYEQFFRGKWVTLFCSE